MTLQLSLEDLQSNLRFLMTCRLSQEGRPLSLVANSSGQLSRTRKRGAKLLAFTNRLLMIHSDNLRRAISLTHEIMLGLPDHARAICHDQEQPPSPLLHLSPAETPRDLISFIEKLQLRFGMHGTSQRALESLERLRLSSDWAGIPHQRGTLAEAILMLSSGSLLKDVESYLHPEGKLTPITTTPLPVETPKPAAETEELEPPLPQIDAKDAVIATLEQEIELLHQKLKEAPQALEAQEDSVTPNVEPPTIVEDTLHRITTQTTLKLNRVIDSLSTLLSEDDVAEEDHPLLPPLDLAREIGLQQLKTPISATPEDNLTKVEKIETLLTDLKSKWLGTTRSLKTTQKQLASLQERADAGATPHPGWSSILKNETADLEAKVLKLELKNSQLKHRCEVLMDKLDRLQG